MSENIPANDSALDLDPELQAAVSAVLSEPIDLAAIERIKAKAKQLSPRSERRRTASESSSSRRTWVSMALAASLLLAIGIAVLSPSTNSAFGQVMKQLREAGAFRYVYLLYMDDSEQPIESTVMVAENGRQRHELLQTVSISDAFGVPRLTLLTDTQTAIVPTPVERKNPPTNETILDWFEKLRNHSGKPERRLDRKELDGRTVDGFVAKVQHQEYVLWIDVATNELVQIEFGPLVKGTKIRQIVMKDFQFNQEFEQSLFSLEVPPGYRIQKLKSITEATGGEQSIISALKGYLKLSEGKFPDSITDWGEWAVLFSRDGELSDEDTQVMGHLGAITPFLVTKSSTDYEYLGKGKTTDGQPSIVFWWRNEEGIIRAINSDLTVTEVEEGDLPQSNETP
ncbi:hypothetical protein [Bythopirellula goksoeyrii]|uniref:Uncharacterized protein n=1 Tax=Bythopirellula goksoeyrii TaxID=1400387 RepID=A0A5B9QAS2_9BACT|nr:hypothetical protein [Bythopirellula goksoeyrii]QEG34572.1 hypothetical protein Pr1d_18530 [Bythopirellula goksoeyrii]